MPTTSPATRRPHEPPAIVRHAFLAILGLWLFMPFALAARPAQDAIPYLAVGHLATDHPEEIYASRNGDLYDLSPLFRAKWCDLAPTGTDCDDLAVAFVSSPPVIALTLPFGWMSGGTGALLMRLSAATMLVAGMSLLWRRLAHRTPNAGWLLVATVLAATPMAMVPIGLGQTSPVLFLSVCLGIGATTGRQRIVSGAVWAAATLLKVFPGFLLFLLVIQKKWRHIAVAFLLAGVTSGITLAVTPTSIWADFVRGTFELSGPADANPYNASLHALLERAMSTVTGGSHAFVATILCLLVAGGICAMGMRDSTDDSRWAVGYVAILALMPLVWWHYAWILLGALGVVTAERDRLDDRLVGLIPLAACLSVVPSVLNGNGIAVTIAQAILLMAGTALLLWIVHSGRAITAPETPGAHPGGFPERTSG